MIMMDNEKTVSGLKQLTSGVTRYLKLRVEDARLTAAEKLTLLLTALTFYALMIIVGALALVFVSIGIGHMLSSTLTHPMWAYIYIAGFYVVLFVLLVVFRQKLIFDPIARFVSRLIVEPPKEAESPQKSHDSEQ